MNNLSIVLIVKIVLTVLWCIPLLFFQSKLLKKVGLPIPEPLIFSILLIVAIIAAAGVGGYFIAYYKILRFPKSIRKVRKFRSTLKSGQNPSTSITSRKESFGLNYKKEFNKTSKHLKGAPEETKVNNSIDNLDFKKKTQGGSQ